MEKGLYDLQIDPELENAIPPVSEDEYKALEQSLKTNGCYSPIITWNNTIIDGHHRYRICRENDIPFYVEEKSFTNKSEAKVWMLNEQFSRRNMSEVQRVVACLKLEPELLEEGRRRMGHDPALIERSNHNTREIIAEKAKAAPSMVQRVKKIWEEADEKTKDDVYWGRAKVFTVWKKLSHKRRADADENTDGKAMDLPKEEEKPVVVAAHLEKPIPFNPVPGDDAEGSRLEGDIDPSDMTERFNDLADECMDEFYKGMKGLRKEFFIQHLPEECAEAYLKALCAASSFISAEMTWVHDMAISGGGTEETNFEHIKEELRIAGNNSKSAFRSALYLANDSHASKENIRTVVDMIDKTHTEILGELRDDLKMARQEKDSFYSNRKAIQELLAACTGADDETIRQAVEMLTPDEEWDAEDKHYEEPAYPFSDVERMVDYSIKTMFRELRLGLGKLSSDDEWRKPELISILDNGEQVAKRLVEDAEGVVTDVPDKEPERNKRKFRNPSLKIKDSMRNPRPFIEISMEYEMGVDTMLDCLKSDLHKLRADNSDRKPELISMIANGYNLARKMTMETKGCQ